MLTPTILGGLRTPLNLINNQVRFLRPCLRVDNERYQLMIDCRQFKKDGIRIKADPQCLLVAGKQIKFSREGYVKRQFIRKFKFPESVVPQKIKTALSREGILMISAPKVSCYSVSPATSEEDFYSPSSSRDDLQSPIKVSYYSSPSATYHSPPKESYDWTPKESYDVTPKENYDVTPKENYDSTSKESYHSAPPPKKNYSPLPLTETYFSHSPSKDSYYSAPLAEECYYSPLPSEESYYSASKAQESYYSPPPTEPEAEDNYYSTPSCDAIIIPINIRYCTKSSMGEQIQPITVKINTEPPSSDTIPSDAFEYTSVNQTWSKPGRSQQQQMF